MTAILTRATAVALAVLLAAPAVCLSTEEGHGGGEAKSVLSPDLINSAVTLVVFLSLLAILYKFAWGPILKGLAAREGAIFAARDEAVKVKHEAEDLRAKLAAEYASANDKIRGLMDEARRDAESLRAAERAAGQKEASDERDRAKRDIESAKDAALQEIYQRSIQLASLMSAKAIRREMTPADHSRLLDESLAELKAGVGRN